MRIVDGHVHLGGEPDVADVLRCMDANGVARLIVFSDHERGSLRKTRELLLRAKKLTDAAPDRLTTLAWVNPVIPGMADLAAEAIEKLGFSGLKIIPDHWYAHDERLNLFWARMNALDARILFHTGILYGFEDGSRFCHPVHLEKLCHYPRIRFAMAHISWPWCEECIAVMGRMRAAANGDEKKWQSYVDLTPGTPRHIRKQAMANAIEFCGAERIMFGTDDKLPSKLKYEKEILDNDLKLFDEIGLTPAQKERILSGTADELFPARK
jgi:predicted TIM-barrel fold metal-dependent hydrolase